MIYAFPHCIIILLLLLLTIVHLVAVTKGFSEWWKNEAASQKSQKVQEIGLLQYCSSILPNQVAGKFNDDFIAFLTGFCSSSAKLFKANPYSGRLASSWNTTKFRSIATVFNIVLYFLLYRFNQYATILKSLA